MKVRCQRCGFTFTLSRESVAAALAQVEPTQAKYYNVDCPKCRRQIKVPVKELRRFGPDQA